MKTEFTEFFAPYSLLSGTAKEYWPTLTMAAVGLVITLLIRGSRFERERVRNLAHLSARWPILCWGVQSAVITLSFWDNIAAYGLEHPSVFIPWAAGLRSMIALFIVATLSSLVAIASPQGIRVGVASDWLGPLAAAGAVSTNWVLLLLLITPIG